jgi:hypothetical protein
MSGKGILSEYSSEYHASHSVDVYNACGGGDHDTILSGREALAELVAATTLSTVAEVPPSVAAAPFTPRIAPTMSASAPRRSGANRARSGIVGCGVMYAPPLWARVTNSS